MKILTLQWDRCGRHFVANCGSWMGKLLPWAVRITLIHQAVEPVLRFHCVRWPYGVDIARQLDTIQRRMYTISIRVPMIGDEDIELYNRRRAKAVASLQREHGSWSSLWIRLLRSWRDHLGRPANRHSWAAVLQHFMTPAQLDLMRVHHGRRGTGTRAISGYIRKRWYESVADS